MPANFGTPQVDPRGLRIERARITEALDLSFCDVPHPLRFVATVFDAPLIVEGAQMRALWFDKSCSLSQLNAWGIRVENDLRILWSRVDGIVKLRGARIGGDFPCSGATLGHENGVALHADGAETRGTVFLDNGFSANGAISLVDAKIDVLVCRGARLVNEYAPLLIMHGKMHGKTINAQRVQVDGSVFLDQGFSATGEVDLLGARIGGHLICSRATLANEGIALGAERAEIGGSVFLDEGFRATGMVSLVGARIGRQLICSGATLEKSQLKLEDAEGIALEARDASIGGRLVFRRVDVTGGVNLSRANATTLDDDLGQGEKQLGSWNDVDPLILEDFAYKRLDHKAEQSVELRCKWLKRTTGFQQRAWRQLVEVYRAQGRDDDAPAPRSPSTTNE
jgi:hypothetical protein